MTDDPELCQPSYADYRDLDDYPPECDCDLFDPAEDAPSLARWPWGSLPIGGEV